MTTTSAVGERFEDDTAAPIRSGRDRAAPGDRAALAAFVAAVVVAFPLIVGRLGAYHWFLRDDWVFVTAAGDTGMADLFEPHNAHFSAVPRAAFVVLWRLVGVRSYVPYQAAVVAAHLSVVVLLRVIMRRSGVGPWLATVAAGSLLLFGPGAQDIVWAFQIGFTGGLALGLGAIVVADRDGPLGGWDAAAFGLALLALMSSGSAIPLVLALGGITLVRRGWRVAAALTAPLAAVYLGWMLIEHPQTETVVGRPSLRVVGGWVRSGVVGTFEALGHWTIVSLLLVAVLVGGLALAWAPWAGEGGPRRRLVPPRTLVTPVALLAGSVVFSAITVWGRWYVGSEGARASRYLYLLAALTLPALAVAAQALVSRRRILLVPACALFLVAVPHNASQFGAGVFGERYMAQHQRIVTTAVRMGFARDVPRDVRPEPDAYDEDVTIGFLLDAADQGKLVASTSPITAEVENEFRIRLGVAQRSGGAGLTSCETRARPLVVSPAAGDRFRILSPVTLTLVDRTGRVVSPRILRRPAQGRELTVELPDLRLRIAPGPGATSFTVCTPPA